MRRKFGTVFTTLNFFVSYEWDQNVGVFVDDKTFWLSVTEHSSLLGLFISCEENKVSWLRPPEPIYKTFWCKFTPNFANLDHSIVLEKKFSLVNLPSKRFIESGLTTVDSVWLLWLNPPNWAQSGPNVIKLFSSYLKMFIMFDFGRPFKPSLLFATITGAYHNKLEYFSMAGLSIQSLMFASKGRACPSEGTFRCSTLG